MQSMKSRMVLFMIRNRHLMQFKLRRERVDHNTSIPKLREEYEAGAQKFGNIPAGIRVEALSINGMTAEWIAPVGASKEKVIFYTHGGGYISGSCTDHRMHVAKFVEGTGLPALLFDYRLAPEHPFPAAVEDSVMAYCWLLEQGIAPENIIIVGESAGGGLCLATLVSLRDQGIPLPCAGVSLSPWTDLKCSGESYRTNARKDISTLGSWEIWGGYYVGDNDPTHPWLSPLYADLKGLPPVMIQVGDNEILLDDSRRFAEKARLAGVDVTLQVWEGMVHCFAILAPMFPEAVQAMEDIFAYIKAHIGIPMPEPVESRVPQRQ